MQNLNIQPAKHFSLTGCLKKRGQWTERQGAMQPQIDQKVSVDGRQGTKENTENKFKLNSKAAISDHTSSTF